VRFSMSPCDMLRWSRKLRMVSPMFIGKRLTQSQEMNVQVKI
jgi:hypothetical protein